MLERQVLTTATVHPVHPVRRLRPGAAGASRGRYFSSRSAQDVLDELLARLSRDGGEVPRPEAMVDPEGGRAQLDLRAVQGEGGGTGLSTDLSEPHLWFSEARAKRRRVVAHLGPTNSGKTHAALGRLRKSRKGVFCSPLRLLAWEVFERLNEGGHPCSLVTGNEIETVDDASLVSCTTEMVDIRPSDYDVAVIDEMQMIGDESRGWAWTRAFLGLAVDELHVCGEPRVLPLLQDLCEKTGDDLEVHVYERLSSLAVSDSPIQDFKSLRAGDCVVAFGRRDLYRLKHLIAKHAKRNCCIIYGKLPPEVRRQQAKLFNESGNGWDVLVATDAIGMGLNLQIGRVIFSTAQKYDGHSRRRLLPHEVKQIAGRAGRYGGRFPSGSVTCFTEDDRTHVCRMMEGENAPLELAGIQPTQEHLEAFAAQSSSFHLVVDRTTGAKVSKQLVFSELAVARNATLSVSKFRARRGRGQRKRSGFSTISISGVDRDVRKTLKQVLKCIRGSDVELLAVPTSRLGSARDAARGNSGDHERGNARAGVLPGLGLDASALGPCAVSIDESMPPPLPGVTLLRLEGGDSRRRTKAVRRLCDAIFEQPRTHESSETSAADGLDMPFTHLLGNFQRAAKVDGDLYFMTDPTDLMAIADLIDHINLPLQTRLAFCRAPIDSSDENLMLAVEMFAHMLAEEGEVPLMDLALPTRPALTERDVASLESRFKIVEAYLWLALRFRGVFVDVARAEVDRARLERMIDEGLATIEKVRKGKRRRRSAERKAERVKGKMGTWHESSGEKSATPAQLMFRSGGVRRRRNGRERGREGGK